MPYPLPDEVLQGLGIPPQYSPPPFDASLAGAPQMDAGPPPMPAPAPIAQDMAPPAELPPPATALPSAGPQGPTPDAAPKEFNVAPAAFGAQQPPPLSGPNAGQAPRPAKPQTFDQQMADQQNRERTAEGEQKQAIGAAYQAQSTQDAGNLAAVQKTQADQKVIADQIKANQDDYTKIYAQKQSDIDARKKELDNYKVDQNKYWNDLGVGRHIGWYIAMAMSGLGDALQGKSGPNPVIQMLQDKVHDNIKGQIDQRDQLRAKLGDARVEQDRYEKFSANKQAQLLAREGEADRELARQLQISAAQSADPMHRANAMKEAALVDEQGAQKQQTAIKLAADHDAQMKAQAIAGGHLALARHAEDRATALFNAEYGPGGYKEQEIGIKNNAELRKEQADAKKARAEGAAFNPITREPFLDQKGVEMRNQAKALEDRAKADPANAPQLLQQAKAMREEALTNVAVIGDKEDRRKVVEGVKYAQDTVDTAAKMKRFLQQDPSLWDRSEWAAFQTDLGSTVADIAKTLGANASSREFEALTKHMITMDPESLTSRTFDKGKMLAQLDHLIASTKRGVNTSLGARGIHDTWQPSSPDENPIAPPSKEERSLSSLKAPTQSGLPDNSMLAAPLAAIHPEMNPKATSKDEGAALAALGARAADGDQSAITILTDLSTTAPRDSVRAAAAAAMEKAIADRKQREYHAGTYDNTTPDYSPAGLISRFHRTATPTLPQ